ncbi:VanW family protein [Arthrobacter sp. MYb227]|uniref:VanW family protein n=1 Tax=Arthrobacter sp. MYb227 TaxID=1848601 RepID=UPI0021579B75|nr:VanW family protein [Arthrobacter sp. MYb227]
MKRGRQRKSRRGWYVAGASVLLAGGLYAGTAAYLGTQIPANTTVHGVNIGSLSPDAAAQVLNTDLKPLALKPVDLNVGEKKAALDPAKAGLGIDIDATLEGLTGFNLNPKTLVERLTGTLQVEPKFVIDQPKLRGALEGLAPKFATATAEGKLAFEGAKPVLKKPVTGLAVDIDAATQKVSTDWFDSGSSLELPVNKSEPKISAATFEELLTGTVEPLVDGPIKLTDDTSTASLSPAQLASAASFKTDGEKITMTLDDEKLIAAAAEGSNGFKSTAKDAKIVLSGGKPTVIPSQTGKSIDPEGLAEKVLAASKDADRSARVTLTTVEPELTTEKATALGVKEPVVTFSTPYPASDTVRTKNLYAGSKRLTGVVVMPGEIFSLEKALGPITVANGYFDSGVVVNGFSSSAVGGGLSQISTQMYNVGFLAGYDDITHKPHSRWFERYPAGREATLWEGQVDMAWKNNSPYAVMIDAWVGGGKVNTRLWSTKYWTVTSKSSPKYNFTNPTTTYNPATKCISESGGKKGFSINVTRTRTSAEKTLPAETKSWTYAPWNKVVCGKKP